MTRPGPKADLLRYLQEARDALLWKLEGLSGYDARRPLTPTGTNLLGLVKHVAGVELGYFGDTFGRPYFVREPPPSWWYTRDAELNADMWATADESREQITGLYRAAWEHSNRTIETLPLDATGHVPWWPEEQREATLHHILVRVIADTQRHAGHADIVREVIDGRGGLTEGRNSLPEGDPHWWENHRRRLERVAREAGDS
ncbi:DinB family protein [Streptomyces sp. NPDC019990]|uniref:DinB family protein n=1 Tax=Streptomyces sp. NPDC019990 TaxID=3154693 RepID=UPI0033CAB5E0